MRLAIYHNHPSGGAARAFHELGRELGRHHEINVFTLETANESFLPSSDYAQQLKIAPYSRRKPLRFGLYLNDVLRYRDFDRLEKVSRSIAADIDRGAYDRVLVSACQFVQAPDVLAHLRSPSAYFCHEPPRRFVDDVCRPGSGSLRGYERARHLWHRPAERWIDRRLQRTDRRNVGAASTVLTNSNYTRDLISQYYSRDADVCYLGVDPERFNPGEGQRERYVLSVGAIESHKGFDFLVRAIGMLPPRERPSLLLVANSVNPSVERELWRLADREAVQLVISADASERQLVDAYRGARVFVYAPYGEPFGLAPLEAMACGVPVLAVAEGGVRETVVPGETGVLVARSERAFAEALSTLLSNPERSAALGREGRRVVEERWTWGAAASRIETALSRTGGTSAEHTAPERLVASGAAVASTEA